MLLCITVNCTSWGQSRYVIYLGDKADSLYTTAAITRHDNGLACPQLEIAGYHTFSHKAIIINAAEKINRAGIILQAKSTYVYHRMVQAYFGKENDTACIAYDVQIFTETNGRSAILSVVNLFSKDKIPQEDPATKILQVLLTGQVTVGDKTAPFSLSYEPYFSKGWLVLNGDTVYTAPVASLIKKGKIKKAKNFYRTGVVLKQGNKTIAALDQAELPDLVHLSVDLNETDKLMVLSFLFITECYTMDN